MTCNTISLSWEGVGGGGGNSLTGFIYCHCDRLRVSTNFNILLSFLHMAESDVRSYAIEVSTLRCYLVHYNGK